MKSDTVQISVSVPAPIADSGAAERACVLLVLDAVRSERLTWRRAAGLLGIAPSGLLDLARAHRISIQRIDADDLALDLATLDRLEARRSAG